VELRAWRNTNQNSRIATESSDESSVKSVVNKNKTNETKSMNNKFDELTKSMAQSVTRRGALKKFGTGLAGMALVCFGLANRAEAKGGQNLCSCVTNADCGRGQICASASGTCVPGWCNIQYSPCCCLAGCGGSALPHCHPDYNYCNTSCKSGLFCQ